MTCDCIKKKQSRSLMKGTCGGQVVVEAIQLTAQLCGEGSSLAGLLKSTENDDDRRAAKWYFSEQAFYGDAVEDLFRWMR